MFFPIIHPPMLNLTKHLQKVLPSRLSARMRSTVIPRAKYPPRKIATAGAFCCYHFVKIFNALSPHSTNRVEHRINRNTNSI